MIDLEGFVKGRYYYFVMYYDKSATLPNIKTVAFIGKNIFQKERKQQASDGWYFQDGDSFFQYGSLVDFSEEMTKKIKPLFYSFQEDSLHVVYDLNGLITELVEIKKRIA